MADLVLVSRSVLEEVLEQAMGNERVYADQLEPGDPVLTIAVQAGLPLPAPMKQGTVPPAPPCHRFASHLDRLVCAATYRTKSDPRLRCEADAKVVYTNPEQAAAAARAISGRTPMQWYLGPCGHYHVARRK
jgi:hypothetical protein